jgi:tRNA modification GTPase
VATLLIEGPGAEPAVRELLFTKGKTWAEFPFDRPILAHFGGEEGEEVVVRRRSRGSLVESIELHCHGGFAAIHAIEQAFTERGFALVSWKEWAENDADDPIATAARIALADACTERTAAILLDQYRGALSRAVAEIESRTGFQPAETASDPSGASFQLDIEKRQVGNLSYINSLLERTPLGLHLTKPWRVALAGEPNVGKSSLLNALLGYSRAIVHHTPGTTRDAVTAQTAFDGWPVELCDTAGLRSATNDIEQVGIELALQQITEADLLLLIFDAGKPWTAADQSLAERYPDALAVHNKSDLVGGDEKNANRTMNCQRETAKENIAHNRPSGIFVSSRTGENIEELAQIIARRLVPDPPLPGEAVPFTVKQVEKLQNMARKAGK